eukprot:EG_transcript_50045
MCHVLNRLAPRKDAAGKQIQDRFLTPFSPPSISSMFRLSWWTALAQSQPAARSVQASTNAQPNPQWEGAIILHIFSPAPFVFWSCLFVFADLSVALPPVIYVPTPLVTLFVA